MKKLLLETSIPKFYMIFMLGVSVLMLTSYFSYAMFTVNKEKKNAITIITGNLTGVLKVDGEVKDTLNVPAGDTKTFTVELSNNNERKARYNFYYKGVLPDNVTIGYVIGEGINTPPVETGVNLEKNGTAGSSNVYKITVNNKSVNNVAINLGYEVGLDYNDLTLPEEGHLMEKYKKESSGSKMKVMSFYSTIGDYVDYITSVVTKDNNEVPTTAFMSMDVSENGDGSVMAYMEADGDNYRLTIGGTGGVIANDSLDDVDFGGLFNGFSKATSIDLTYFDTSQVTNMEAMFCGCSSLLSLDLSSFDTSQVTDMGFMFVDCYSLTNLDLRSFDTSKVTDMYGMFAGCDSLTNLDLRSFDTSNVTNMYCMFSGCSSLTSLDLRSFNTSQVTDMEAMFENCQNLTSLDLRSFDTSNVTVMNSMFSRCSNLTEILVSSQWSIKGEETGDIFNGCGVSEVTYV